MVALRLSKEGFGRPDEILKMRCDLVLTAFEYSAFLRNYENAVIEMNKGKN